MESFTSASLNRQKRLEGEVVERLSLRWILSVLSIADTLVKTVTQERCILKARAKAQGDHARGAMGYCIE